MPLVTRPHRAPTVSSNYAYGSFTSQGPVTALGSSLKAWLTADDHGTARMTDDGSGVISSWTSKDGSALTVTAATTARPTWSTSAIASPTGSSYAGLTFDGVANCLVTTTLTNIPTSTTARHIFALVSQDDAATSGLVLIRYGGTAVQTFVGLQKNATTSGTILASDGTTSTSITGGFNGIHAVKGFWSGTTQTVGIDGAFTATGTLGTTLNTSTTRFRIGANTAATAAGFYKGVVRHIFITTTLTTLQAQQLEAWMLWDIGWHRYRLPSTHPFRDRRP